MPAQLTDEELFTALDAEQYFDKVYEFCRVTGFKPASLPLPAEHCQESPEGLRASIW